MSPPVNKTAAAEGRNCVVEKRLTDHFTLRELTRSATATRLGLDNTPPADLLFGLREVAETLELVRAYFRKPVLITSGYRSPEVNKAVGGSPASAHMLGLAVDFTVVDVPTIDVCRQIEIMIPDYDQVIYEFGPNGWCHLGLAHRPRRQSLTAIKRDGKTAYSRGIIDFWS